MFGAFAQTNNETSPSDTSPETSVTRAQQPTPEQLGDALMLHQRYQAAIETYKRCPNGSAIVLNKLGIAYQMLFNTEEAMKYYKASLHIDPNNEHVLNNLGTVYDSLRQYVAAERMYRKALKINPKSALIQRNLGTNLLAQRKYSKGWEAYQTALAIDPDVFEHDTHLRIGNPASTQDRGAINYYMAKSYAHAGMKDRAIEYLRVALNEGFTTPKKLNADSEFASLRGIPAYQQLLADQGTP